MSLERASAKALRSSPATHPIRSNLLKSCGVQNSQFFRSMTEAGETEPDEREQPDRECFNPTQKSNFRGATFKRGPNGRILLGENT